MLKNSNNYGRKKSNVTVQHHLQVSNNYFGGILYKLPNSKILKLVDSFNLTESNCYEKNLKINFYLKINEYEATKLITTYLEPHKSCFQNKHFVHTSEKQEYSLYCSRIKRYYLNSSHHILFVDEQARLIESNEMDSFIEMDFLNNLNLITFLFFKINHYDEEKNDILIGKFFWTTVRLICIWDVLKSIRNYFMNKLSSFINVV